MRFVDSELLEDSPNEFDPATHYFVAATPGHWFLLHKDHSEVKRTMQALINLDAIYNPPIDKEEFRKEWARMASLCARNVVDAEDTRMMMSAYYDECRAFPADMVRSAFRAWPRENKWLPDWESFEELIGRGNGVRFMLKQFARKAKKLMENDNDQP